jgi:ABC-type transporter Mla maintaining outer membrane lipid asymmetry ATPase subunit MlaF
MKTAIHFQNAFKSLSGSSVLRISDLKIVERESIGFYGLPTELIEIVINELTGAYDLDEGSVTIFDTDTRDMDERSWFRFVEKVGIYKPESVLQESLSIGENVASYLRARNDAIEEPQLSAMVLKIANLVQLTITELSKQMSDATAVQRVKVHLSRTFAYHPAIVVASDPTSAQDEEVSRKFVEIVKRARRKLKFTLLFFTSDLWLLEQLADRAIFLNPRDGHFVENQLRGWYHKLLPFLNPSPGRLLQLSLDALQHSWILKEAESRLEH